MSRERRPRLVAIALRVLQLGYRSFVRRPTRLVLFISATSVMFVSVTLLVATELKLRSMHADDEYLGKSVRIRTANRLLKFSEIEQFRSLPQVKGVCLEEQGLIIDPEHDPVPATVMSTACLRLFGAYLEVDASAEALYARTKNAVIIGSEVALRKHLAVGDKVTVDAEGHPIELVVTSISDRGSDLKQVRIQSGLRPPVTGREDYIEQAYLLVDTKADIDVLGNEVLKRYPGVPLFDPWLSKVDGLRYWMSRSEVTIRVLRFAGGLALTLTFVLTITMIVMAAEERERELATLRAIGFSSISTASLVIVDGVLLGVPGGILGAVGAFVIFYGRKLPMQGLQPTIGITAIAITCTIGLAMSLLAAVVPAYRVARMNLLAGLRAG